MTWEALSPWCLDTSEIYWGIFKAMAGAGLLTSSELAEKTNLNERYIREWAKAMVVAEYLDYDPYSDRYIMTDEQACVPANEDSQMFVGGAFHFTTPTILNVQKIMNAFRDGGGISYSDIGEEIPEAIERFFRPGYVHFLAKDWLGSVPGLTKKLEKGVNIADIGCGCGQSSVAMAKDWVQSLVKVGQENLLLQQAFLLLKNFLSKTPLINFLPSGANYISL